MTDNAGDKAVQKSASMLEKLNLNERSWKFYAAASIPPALVAGLALWYYSSRSSESTKKDDKKKRPRKGKKAKKSKSADDSAEE
ncbi:hypothetical protein EV176_007332, partial [Coemansia sp. RSA 451]